MSQHTDNWGGRASQEKGEYAPNNQPRLFWGFSILFFLCSLLPRLIFYPSCKVSSAWINNVTSNRCKFIVLRPLLCTGNAKVCGQNLSSSIAKFNPLERETPMPKYSSFMAFLGPKFFIEMHYHNLQWFVCARSIWFRVLNTIACISHIDFFIYIYHTLRVRLCTGGH